MALGRVYKSAAVVIQCGNAQVGEWVIGNIKGTPHHKMGGLPLETI